ncbi:MAG: hypothetical protein H7336_08785 [Bacteriovorax sp.]|nr:hypothetical protein [Bacteriovorax sp.]
MKSLFVVFASLLFSSHLQAESVQKPELTDSFTDVIKSVSEEGHVLVVKFNRHAAIYKVGKEHPQFAEIKAKLEKAQKIDQKVKVVAIIPSMTIKEISNQ